MSPREIQLLESTVRILELFPKAEDRSRIRLRVCRVGVSCPSCGGAAWVADCKTKAPTSACKPVRAISAEVRAIKAHLQSILPAWAARHVSF